MKLSLVIVSFNQAQFLERTLRSVCIQKPSNIELLAIDGGSTDGSVKILEKYDDYLDYWISEVDNGQSDALRKGFNIASGEYIGWLNSDDIFLNNSFTHILRTIKNSPHADVIYGKAIWVNENDDIINVAPHEEHSDFLFRRLGPNITQPGSFFRREKYMELGGLSEDYIYGMDYEFFCRLFKSGAIFVFCNHYLSGFRKHSSQKGASTQYLEACNIEHNRIVAKYDIYKQGSVRYRLFSLFRYGKRLFNGYYRERILFKLGKISF